MFVEAVMLALVVMAVPTLAPRLTAPELAVNETVLEFSRPIVLIVPLLALMAPFTADSGPTDSAPDVPIRLMS